MFIIDDIAQKIVENLGLWANKKLERNHKVLKLLNTLGIGALKGDFDSIYAHALVEFAVDAVPTELVLLFAAKDVKAAFKESQVKDAHSVHGAPRPRQAPPRVSPSKKGAPAPYDGVDFAAVLVHQLQHNKKLSLLPHTFKNARDLDKEIRRFREAFDYYTLQTANPLLLKKYNEDKKFQMEILADKERESFEFRDYKKKAAEKKSATAQRRPLIKKESANRYDFHPGEPVPCAIKQIKIRNYLGIIKTDILLPADARWIFLTGENAYGKTVILRALAIGLFGPVDESKILLDLNGKSKIDVEICTNGGSLINRVGTPGFKPFTCFAAYGPSRLQIQSHRTQNEITGMSTKTYSLFNDDGVSLNIERELVLWYLDNDKKYEIVRKILLGLMPHGADIMVNRADKEVLYIEKESPETGGASFKPVRSRELAAGNKSIIAMIGDMVIRFYKEYETIAPGLHPKDFEGIVIIDELDLHLHPKWLRRLPGILSGVFPKIQFVASTHSEVSLLGAPRESVFLKVDRTQKQGIQIRRLPIAIENLLSHHLLTSPIFDMEEESIQAGNDNLSNVRTEDNFKKIEEINKIKKELKTMTPKERERLKSLLEDAGQRGHS